MTVNTLGGDLAGGKARAAAWLPPLVPIAIATFALSALVSYHLRTDGGGDSRSLLQWTIIGIYQFVGFVPSFLFFLLVLSWSSIWFVTGKLERPGALLVRLLGLTLALAIWVNLRVDTGEVLPHSGALGAWIGGSLVSVLGTVISTLLVAPLTLVSLLLATDYFFISYFEGLGAARTQPATAGRQVSSRGSSTGTRSGAGGELGVEDDVTEQFKSLARVFTQPGPTGSGGRAEMPVGQAPLGDLVAIDDLEAAIRSMEEPESSDQSESRRLSHFERRQLAAARGATTAGDDASELEDQDAAGDSEAGDSEVETAAASSPRHEDAGDDEFTIAAAAFASGADRAGDEAIGMTAAAALGGPEQAEDVDAEPVARGWLAPLADAGEGSELPASPEPASGTSAPGGDATPDAAADDDIAVGTTSSVAQSSITTSSVTTSGVEGDDDADADVVEASEDDDGEGLVVADDDAEDDADFDAIHAAAVEPREEIMPIEPVEAEVGADERIVAIPRPAEGARQQRLFVSGLDESLVREAIEIVQSSRRASAALLQRKLRIEFEQAVELLALLAHRGMIELTEDGTHGRVRS